jgi:hypothetical protein
MEALHLTKTVGRPYALRVLNSEGTRDMGDMGLLVYRRVVGGLSASCRGSDLSANFATLPLYLYMRECI